MWKLSPYIIIGALAAFLGWQVASWQFKSQILDQQKANEKTLEIARKISKESSASLEQKLEDLKNVEPSKTIYREMVKPIFTNVCVSPEFVLMYNKSVSDAERVLSGKSKSNVSSGQPTKTSR